MKRIFTKMLCFVAALACMASLAGCGGGVNSANAEAEAKAAVTGFMDAIVGLDTDAAKMYVDNAAEMDSELLDSLDVDDLLEEAIEGNEAFAGFEDKVRPMFDTIIEKAKSVMSYEIVGSQQLGSDYVFDVKITAIDDEKAGDLDDVMENSLSEYLTEDAMMKLGTKLLEEGKITAQSTETEIIGAVFDELMPEINKAIENLEITTKVIEGKVVASEYDGKWLVNVAKSDLD